MMAITFSQRLPDLVRLPALPRLKYRRELTALRALVPLQLLRIPTFPAELTDDFLTMNGDYVTINGERITF